MIHTLVWNRFRALLLASVVLSGVDYVGGMIELVIGGSFLGSQAVAGLTLLAPAMPLLSFIGLLIVSGSMTLYAYAGGRADEEEMNRIYSQALILCFTVGLLISGLMIAAKETVLSIWSVSPEVAAYAASYYDGIALRPPIHFVGMILLSLLLAQSEVERSLAAVATQLIVMVAAILFLVPRIGILGISLGTTLGFLGDALVKSTFLFSGKCPVKPRFYLNAGKILEVLRTSFGMALATFWVALLPFIMTSYLLAAFGEDVLVVFCVINSILCLAISVFQGLEGAMQPMVCMYFSEGNLKGTEKTMKVSAAAAAALGVGMTVIFLSLSGVLPELFGADSEELVRLSKTAMLAVLPFLMFRALGMVFSSYCAYTGKVGAALVLQALMHLVFPFGLAVLGGSLFGLTGVWLGLGISGLLILAAEFLFTRFAAWKNPRLEGILMMDREKYANQLSYDCLSLEDEVMATEHQAETDLIALGLPEDKSRFAGFFIEEMGMNAADRSEGRTPFEVETTLIREDDMITMIVRDNGKMEPGALSADITNPDADLESFRMYVVSQVASKLDYRSYIMIGGENRTAIRF